MVSEDYCCFHCVYINMLGYYIYYIEYNFNCTPLLFSSVFIHGLDDRNV